MKYLTKACLYFKQFLIQYKLNFKLFFDKSARKTAFYTFVYFAYLYFLEKVTSFFCKN